MNIAYPMAGGIVSLLLSPTRMPSDCIVQNMSMFYFKIYITIIKIRKKMPSLNNYH